MQMVKRYMLTSLLGVTLIAGCAGTGGIDKQTAGTAIGIGAGGLVGSLFGSGFGRVAATIGGAAIGGLVGGAVGRAVAVGAGMGVAADGAGPSTAPEAISGLGAGRKTSTSAPGPTVRANQLRLSTQATIVKADGSAAVSKTSQDCSCSR